jgi:hypothetical protein
MFGRCIYPYIFYVLTAPAAPSFALMTVTYGMNDCTWTGDIADASKHARLSVPKKAPRQISTAEQLNRPLGIFDAPFGTAVFGEASWVMVTMDALGPLPASCDL